jgi:hypothetical protein
MSANNQIPPSLDLSFEWVKNVLNEQSRAADALESKATTLFSVATVILGLVISAGVLSLHNTINLPAIIFGALTLISYGWAIGFSIAGIRLLRYETLDNPVTIREWYWDMQPSQFKTELLTHMEDSFSKNELKLKSKAKAIRWLIFAMSAEVMFSAFLLAFTL